MLNMQKYLLQDNYMIHSYMTAVIVIIPARARVCNPVSDQAGARAEKMGFPHLYIGILKKIQV